MTSRQNTGFLEEHHAPGVIPSVAKRSRWTPFPLCLIPAGTASRIGSLLTWAERNERGFFVYMMASDSGTLYIGITNDLCSRVVEHITDVDPRSFTCQYQCHRLIYFETFIEPGEAIAREKQLKRWRRDKKEKLIASFNQKWINLAPQLLRKRGPSTPLRFARDDMWGMLPFCVGRSIFVPCQVCSTPRRYSDGRRLRHLLTACGQRRLMS